jgi:lipid-A-disaccharide synthase
MSTSLSHTLCIGLVAGESSGDILGADLMKALKGQVNRLGTEIEFIGLGGPLMEEQGLISMAPMERLSVMGIIDPLFRLPELLLIRFQLKKLMLSRRPEVFISIDSPDFNLSLAKYLRKSGIPTVHYVSPSVWAWRAGRIQGIKKAIDLMLTLFPFETAIYEEYKIKAVCVGHPLADMLPLEPDQEAARDKIGQLMGVALTRESFHGKLIALLPGSRTGEVAKLGPVFAQTALLISKKFPELTLLLPAASKQCRDQLDSISFPSNVIVLDGYSRLAMTAADAVILASGTATLEALLLKRPMLVVYKMAWLSYKLISKLVKVKNFSLPNLLAGREIVEEKVQDDVNPEAIVESIPKLLAESADNIALREEFLRIHLQLRRGGSNQAAQEILYFLGKGQ